MKRSLVARAQHVLADFAAEALKRRAAKRLSLELEVARPGSFPFISADTFRSLADIVIENGALISRKPLSRRSVIYFDLSGLEGTERNWRSTPLLDLLAESISSQPLPPVVILHNGDRLPSAEILEQLQAQSFHVFSSNVLNETPHLTAIPVGIENAYRNTNGGVADFIKSRDNQPWGERDIRIFSRFNVHNNPRVRRPLAQTLASSRFGWSDHRLTPQEHRLRVLASKIVLSPPGNGIDCHRTWEAIYLGAVPAVLSAYSPPGLFDDMPALRIDSFEELIYMSDSEIDLAFETTAQRSVEKCFMPYWVTKIRGMALDE